MFKLNTFNRAGLIGLTTAMLLTACGSNDSRSIGESEPAAYQGVSGPLDVLQAPLSEQVLGQIASAAAGTPLEGAVECVDQIVVQDTVDILDSILGAVSPTSINDPQQAFTDAAGNVQLAVTELIADLPALLGSLVGQGDCTGPRGDAAGGNPLAGTPLAPLADALGPLLTGAGGDFGSGENLDLTAVQALTDQLSSAFNEGLASLPAEVSDAPVLGGLLVTLQTTFNDLDATVAAIDDGSGEETASAIATTLDNLLGNLLTQVVPIQFIEDQAGVPGAVSSQIQNGIGQVTAQLDNGLGAVLEPTFGALFDGALAPLFGGLNMLLTPLGDVISSGLVSGGGGAGPTGTPLDALLAPLEGLFTALTAGSGGGGLTGTPLDVLLDPLASVLGGGGSCPLEATPLNPLCAVVDGLLGGSNNPLGLLTGLVDQLLSGLLGGRG